jgi:hypothetical protein
MFRFAKTKTALFVAVLLTLVMPAAIDAARPGTLDRSAASTPAVNTALGRNLLSNPSFEQASQGGIPAWSVDGALHLERFGTRTWPNVAYSKKYSGGDQYLACSQGQGTISQTVDWNGWRPRHYILKSRFSANFGGTIENRIRGQIRFTGGGHAAVSRSRTRTLDITNSYKRIVITLMVPDWADHITVTLQLLPKAGASKCDVVADSLNLSVFKP